MGGGVSLEDKIAALHVLLAEIDQLLAEGSSNGLSSSAHWRRARPPRLSALLASPELASSGFGSRRVAKREKPPWTRASRPCSDGFAIAGRLARHRIQVSSSEARGWWFKPFSQRSPG